ncbi:MULTISPECIES: rhodanese-like domain-containing protein [unclassified Pseudodesulfovibrio]|uniref:rhodanese-like domain-containing protein n=1 Tax=unclassified Pseudodesulfovibrio TaxID=2661612 RepID=UPI000FEB887E|nr:MULTISPECIES: rhodanese-like domain-containing protein [unclassified Pseudodesulfovibrio]MCJ2164946.1 sulfurtransferase [Pseudodesulfovibrio sp. S3-i]RWU03609.1 sulfurtransferase [Pseudodesulfovibrio sp. S3]
MTEITMMTPDQARSFIDGNKPDSYTLLDVRQQWEYDENHIPGARLLPLVDLADRMEEVPKDLPVLVYCASGGRSMAAASLLEGSGYTDIANLVGGMGGWDGHTAFGSMELDMITFSGRETPVEVILKAYAMESSLQRFYVERADMAETLERIQLFMELADFEDRHKDILFERYLKISGSDMSLDQFEEIAFSGTGILAEGGVEINEFLDRHPAAFDDEQGVLQLATMVEAQALDYYLRCAKRAESEETRDVLQLLAREEKAHLKLLGRFMDKRDI